MATRKLATRTFDFTAVPGGPHGEFPRQLIETLDSMERQAEELETRLSASESESEAVRTRPVRVSGLTSTTAAPYEVDPAEYPTETIFDDVNEDAPPAAATQYNLPTIAAIDAAGIDRATEVLRYGFRRTSGQTLRVKAAAGTTLGVDSIPESVDGGTLDLLSTNSYVLFELIDDQWRSVALAGEFKVDA